MAKKLTGRPPVIIDPKQIEQLASLWLTKEATADFLGVGRSTLFDKLREDPEIAEAWHRGRAKLQASTMQGLIASARNGSVRAQTFLAERVCGLKESVIHEGEVTTRYVVEIPPEEPASVWQANYGSAGNGSAEPPDVIQ